MTHATLHDGTTIEVEVRGDGPVVLLPVDTEPATGAAADTARAWGMDPELGRSLVNGLADRFRVVAFAYEKHVLAAPKPDTLTPDNLARDLLAVADAVGAPRFAYYGYSWLALAGLQLAIRTDRLWALVMGGYPPADGPYAEMLEVTRATHRMAGSEPVGRETPSAPSAPSEPGEFDWSTAEVTLSEPQTRQFVTLYEALQSFDDRGVRLHCPRLCFAGSADEIRYDERWGGVTVSIAGPFVAHRKEIEAAGWDVEVLDGLDHTQAMQPGNVLPILRPWLIASSAAG